MTKKKEPRDFGDYTPEKIDNLLTKEDMIELAHEMGYLFPTDPGYPKELLAVEDKAKIAKKSERKT
ncbi:hypothetical protein [Schleiferilactobacillus harbinensis]|uniref:hypothetical protein n=1 Tax=Schleiferilactobacillus harbinensis TaxID=304207 RepID=UPI0039EA95E8